MPSPRFITEISPTPKEMPQAFLLELWRKLDRSIDHYFDSRRIARPDGAAAVERFLEDAPGVGQSVADDMRALRAQYVRAVDSRIAHIPADEAQQFVVRAASVMRVLTSQGPMNRREDR